MSPEDATLAAGCGFFAGRSIRDSSSPVSATPPVPNVPIYDVHGNTKAPVPKWKPEPPYSKKARRAGIQGTVLLWVVVGMKGNVEEASVVRPVGLGLDESALHTVRTWRFKPATREGIPVPVRIMIELAFRTDR